MSKPVRSRALVSFSEKEIKDLLVEAKLQGLKLATYLRHLVVTHPERASGAGTR